MSPIAGLNTEARGKIRSLCRGQNPDRPVRSSDTILTEIPRLLHTHGLSVNATYIQNVRRYSIIGKDVSVHSLESLFVWELISSKSSSIILHFSVNSYYFTRIYRLNTTGNVACLLCGRVIAQAVSRRLPTAEARIHA
jgi:hypothetical protein